MEKNGLPAVAINYISYDFPITELDNPAWENASEVAVGSYWSGTDAPIGRRFRACLLWSDTSLYIRFDAEQVEPLVISETPNLHTKTFGLWDRDVCEIFLAPDRSEPRKYFEFEVAPTGEWVDLFIDFTGDHMQTNAAFDSGMGTSAAVSAGGAALGMLIPLKAFGQNPKLGDTWLGNLFRCVGKDPNRGYLAFSPTETEAPNFHVPEKFIEFEFKGEQSR